MLLVNDVVQFFYTIADFLSSCFINCGERGFEIFNYSCEFDYFPFNSVILCFRYFAALLYMQIYIALLYLGELTLLSQYNVSLQLW